MTEFFCQPCIAQMPAEKFWLFLIVAAAVALSTLSAARTNIIRARLVEDMPTSRIRSASQGYVELMGLAIARAGLLSAPLSARPCLWWQYRIERYRKSGKSHSWVTVDKGASSTPFFIDDGTGVCRIEPEGAEISCLHRKQWYGSSRLPAGATPSPRTSLIHRLGAMSGRYRYTEHLIRDGDPIYLLGHFESDASGRRVLTLDQIAGQLIRTWKADYSEFLVRFDSDGNGVLDEQEWQNAQAEAARAAREHQAQARTAIPEHVVRKPQARGLPYLIGSHGQEALSRKFRRKAFFCCTGFLASGAMATWMISSRFVV
ncbi:MAG: GIDE domain-containing protein [Porticoccaceae bacterium]